jgi:predicted HD superfamily hydrolase involved in NAD metabolism
LLSSSSPSAAQPIAGASDLLRLCAAVRSSLPRDRYRHVLGVARTAERLARRYGCSTAAARVAGLLHDISRSWSPQQLLDYAREHGLGVSPAEAAAPILLHARVGAHRAQHEFGVSDPHILEAIERHTIPVEGMSDLAKIVYIADSIEPSRTFAEREAVAAAAERSLEEGMTACLEASLRYLKSRGLTPDPATLALYRRLTNGRSDGHEELS